MSDGKIEINKYSDLIEIIFNKTINTRQMAKNYFRKKNKTCDCHEPVRFPDLHLDKMAVQYHALGQICLHEDVVFSTLDLIENSIRLSPSKDTIECTNYILEILDAKLRLHESLGVKRHIISLGETCLPKTLPTKWGLKASRAMGEKTMPFDLSIHPLPTVLETIEDNFADYFNEKLLRYNEEFDYITNLDRGIHWNHETGQRWVEDNFENFRSVYSRRISNFQSAAYGNILWFACSDSKLNDEFIKKLCEVLVCRYPNANGVLAVLSSDTNQPTGSALLTSFPLPVAYLNLPLPFEGYRWWSVEDFSTQKGMEWERCIAEWLEDLVAYNTAVSSTTGEKDYVANIKISLEQQTEHAIAEYVLSGRLSEPEITLQALQPIVDVPHPQQPWVWKTIADAALAVDDIDLFLEFSRRFIMSDATHRADYRIGKLGMMYDRIKYLLERGLPIEDEQREFHALSPSQFDLDRIASLGVNVDIGQHNSFDDDGPIQILPASEKKLQYAPFFIAPHFAAVAKQSVPMTIRIVNNADYISIGADTALIRPDGSLYRHLSRSPAVYHAWEDAKQSGRQRLLGGTALILNDIFTLSNYCHWMLDWLPRLLAAQEFAGPIDYVCTRHAIKPFEIETLCNVAGLQQNQILLDSKEEVIHFDRAILVDNHRIAETHPIWSGNAHVIERLRRRVFATADGKIALRQKRRVYLSRKDAGNRLVINEDALTDILSNYDVEIVSIGGLSVVDQARLFSECELVIGVHGAGLANIAFMPSGGSVLELFHYQFGSEAYATLAHGCGHRYGYLSCDSVPGSQRPVEHPPSQKATRYQYSDIWVEPMHLDQALASLCQNSKL